MNKNLLLMCVFLCMVTLPYSLKSNSNPNVSDSDMPGCFHVNVNKLNENKVVQLPLIPLCIEYDDKYGKASQLSMKLFNWKHELIKSEVLDKSYGKNDYIVNLEEYGISEDGELYHLVFENELRKKYALSFRIPLPPDKPDPLVNIFVNPVLLECASSEGNLVEFYGSIEGGKAPYDIRWILLESNNEALLYRPEENKVEKAGYTPTIQIDKSPGYIVMLEVRDSCGKEGKQIVNVKCDERLEKYNSVFIQPIPEFPDNSNK